MIFARLGDKKQTGRQNMAEIVFSLGVSEIKCIIFKVTEHLWVLILPKIFLLVSMKALD
jgi:hypothetical protein